MSVDLRERFLKSCPKNSPKNYDHIVRGCWWKDGRDLPKRCRGKKRAKGSMRRWRDFRRARNFVMVVTHLEDHVCL